jgi:serine/threonine-protein kinase RsbT
MAVSQNDTVPLRSQQDVVMARQLVRKLTQDLKYGLVDQTKFVTAASELARNAVIHGGGGEMCWAIVEVGGRTGLKLSFQDSGKGIPNVELAMMDGWTSGGGLGMGLSGAKRLVNEFEIQSELGKGTRVAITRWK